MISRMKGFPSLLLAACVAGFASAENFGNETTTVAGDILVKFTSSGTFVLDQPATARVLVVGGGGAGGTGIGGGSGGTNGSNKNGAAGGSGVVVIRWFAPKGTVLIVK